MFDRSQEGQSRLDDSPRGGGRRSGHHKGIVIQYPSSTYFNITDIPSYLGTGKNTIRLLGFFFIKKKLYKLRLKFLTLKEILSIMKYLKF